MQNLASEVLKLTRSLLRDSSENCPRFSDRELLDNLKIAQNELITEFRENIHLIEIEAKSEFRLEKTLAYIFSASLDNAPLKVLQATSALGLSESSAKNDLVLTHFGANRYGILNLAKGAQKTLKIVASCYENEILSLDSEMALDSSFNRALSLGLYCQMLLIETNSANPQKLQFYKAQYLEAKNELRARKNGLSSRVQFTKINI